jgi:hypothetical protein
LGRRVGARDTAIPYWIIEDDLPLLPEVAGPEIRIVTVCSCGEHGCGHTNCRVVHDREFVVFRDFDLDVSPEGRQQEFRFTRANYEAVVSAIVSAAREYRARTE